MEIAYKIVLIHTYTIEELYFLLEEAHLLQIKENFKSQKLENRIQQIKSELRKKGESIK